MQFANEFYKLHIPFAEREIKIIDLGNIIIGESQKDTQFAVASVVLHLLTRKVIPIIIGGGHDLSYGQYLGYQELIQTSKHGSDRRENRHHSKPKINAKMRVPFYLVSSHTIQTTFSIFHLSDSRPYLNNPFMIEMLESLNYDCVRLGIARQRIDALEPLLRDADLVSIDMSAMSVWLIHLHILPQHLMVLRLKKRAN
jgi:formiminoglutamase